MLTSFTSPDLPKHRQVRQRLGHRPASRVRQEEQIDTIYSWREDMLSDAHESGWIMCFSDGAVENWICLGGDLSRFGSI